MSSPKTKLELTWIGKDQRPKLEPRILVEDPEISYAAKQRVTEADIFDNVLIHGDNLLALRALEAHFAGKVKCVYIDPPFNTKQAFEFYDDAVEHSTWLSLMRERLDRLHRLLAEDGTLFVHIDDNELGYLIVLLDEVFGRNNRVSTVTFKQGSATGHKAINPGCVTTSNFVLIYARNKAVWAPNRLFTGRERDSRYNQFIENVDDDFTCWRVTTLTKGYARVAGVSEQVARAQLKKDPDLLDQFVLEHGQSVVRLARPDYKSVSAAARELIDESTAAPQKIFHLEREEHKDFYLIGGERILFYSDKLKLIDGTWTAAEPLTTIWDDIGSNNLHKEGSVEFPKGKKPEGLIKRVIELSTKPGDIVLDSFAGSGTTGAVAHKMGRRWLMVELGDHALTHVVPRLKKVVEGQDLSGVTEATNWKGGGGFRYYRLAPSLLEKDKWGNWVVSRKYNPAQLAEAVCKLHGFCYEPSPTLFWQHGHSTESDFIYVTTQTFLREQLAAISAEVGSQRTLLVVCAAYHGKADAFSNLTVKKIPASVLASCEWGRDDYSLNVANVMREEPMIANAPAARPTKSRAKTTAQVGLFSQGGKK